MSVKFTPRRKTILDFPTEEIGQAIYVLDFAVKYLESHTRENLVKHGLVSSEFQNAFKWCESCGVAKEFLEKIKEVQES